MYQTPIPPKIILLKITGQVLKWRRQDTPEHEFLVFCPRKMTKEECAAIEEIVCERLRRRRPVATVRTWLKEGDFALALKSLERTLNQ
jgi:hypothetical protein